MVIRWQNDASHSLSPVTPGLSHCDHEQSDYGSYAYAQQHGLSLEMKRLSVINLSRVEISPDHELRHHFPGVQTTTRWQLDYTKLHPRWMEHKFIITARDIYSEYGFACPAEVGRWQWSTTIHKPKEYVIHSHSIFRIVASDQ